MNKISSSKVIPEYQQVNRIKRLGLILLSSDLTTEPDYARMISPNFASIYSTRLKMENPITVENLSKMKTRITESAMLLPEDHPPLSICYSCTAASIVLGDRVIEEAIGLVWPDVPVVTPSRSAINALKMFNIKNVSILTPYIKETSTPFIKYFSDNDLNVVKLNYMGIEDDRMMARVKPKSIFEAACNLDNPKSEAIFISCTALPAIGVIDALEEKLNKPIITSNQVTCWEMMKYGKIDFQPKGFGKLFNSKTI